MSRLGATCFGGALALAGALAAQQTHAGDPAAGRALAGQCRTCHGLDGVAAIPIAPNIGGEPTDYLVRQLAAFRDGTRQHEMMSVVAANLSDGQIADLAAWYAAHEPVAEVAADAGAPPETCVACHGADGIATIEGAPHLAGETPVYIETQLKAFRLGKRESEIMSPVAAEMSDDEIRAAADYYGVIGFSVVPPE